MKPLKGKRLKLAVDGCQSAVGGMGAWAVAAQASRLGSLFCLPVYLVFVWANIGCWRPWVSWGKVAPVCLRGACSVTVSGGDVAATTEADAVRALFWATGPCAGLGHVPRLRAVAVCASWSTAGRLIYVLRMLAKWL